MHALVATVFTALALSTLPLAAHAWGATGHRLVSTIGVASLPADVPAFLRTPHSLAWIGELGREPDRSKGSGHSHDRDLDPGHFLNLGDSGLVMDAVTIDPLPPAREDYATALQAHGISEYRAGFLPYSIVDGWQQLRKDFAYWRADVAAARHGRTPQERTWFDQDRRLREMLILRDLGYWSHFVADASQPMHVSVHYNGWGSYPNPEGFTQSQSVHAYFEGQYVNLNVRREDVAAALPPARDLGCDIERRTVAYLFETRREVASLYRHEKAGEFAEGDAKGRAFVVARLAAAAAELRDMIGAAWLCSAETSVGYPPVPAKDVETGTGAPFNELRGRD